MGNNVLVKASYILLLGILLAIFLGVGIHTFYPEPKAPDYPAELNYGLDGNNKEQVALQKDYDMKNEAWEKKLEPYNRNVSITMLIGAVALAALSIFFETSMILIADVILLGGVVSIIYALGIGFSSGSSKYSFVAISVSLILVLVLGYHRFNKTDMPTNPNIE